MKKVLLLLFAVLFGLQIKAAETKESSFDFDFTTDNWPGCSSYKTTITSKNSFGGSAWKLDNFNNNNFQSSWTNARTGNKTEASEGRIYNTEKLEYDVTRIVVNTSRHQTGTNDKVTSVKLEIADNSSFNNPTVVNYTGSLTSFGDWEFKVPTGAGTEGFFRVVFNCPKTTNNGVVGVNKLTVYYNEEDGETDPPVVEPEEPDTPSGDGDVYVLVTDVNDLGDSAECLIVNASANKALSTTQNNNNRGAAEVTISNNEITNISTDVQVITIAKDGTKNDNTVYYLKVGDDGYLYAASSSANQLKTQKTNNDNGRATISITSTGTAEILFQGSYTRNKLQYNSGSTLFACYSGDQQAVQIYKKKVPTPEAPVLMIGTTEVTTNPYKVSGNAATVTFSCEGAEEIYYKEGENGTRTAAKEYRLTKDVTLTVWGENSEGKKGPEKTVTFYVGNVAIPVLTIDGIGELVDGETYTVPKGTVVNITCRDAGSLNYSENGVTIGTLPGFEYTVNKSVTFRVWGATGTDGTGNTGGAIGVTFEVGKPVPADGILLDNEEFGGGTASQYIRMSKTDGERGYTFSAVYKPSSDNMLLNASGNAGSAIVVSGIGEKYYITSIDIKFANAGSGVNVLSYNEAFEAPALGKAPSTPSDVKYVATGVKENQSIAVAAPAFAIYNAGSGDVEIESIAVHYAERPAVPSAPVLTIAGNPVDLEKEEMEVMPGTEVVITCEGAKTIVVEDVDGNKESGDAPYSYTINEETILTIYGVNALGEKGEEIVFSFTLADVHVPAIGDKYVLVKNGEAIEDGAHYVIASGTKAMSKNFTKNVQIESTDAKVEKEVLEDIDGNVLVLEAKVDGENVKWYFVNPEKVGTSLYKGMAVTEKADMSLPTDESKVENTKVTFDNSNNVQIRFASNQNTSSVRYIKFSTTNVFKHYAVSDASVLPQLYKYVKEVVTPPAPLAELPVAMIGEEDLGNGESKTVAAGTKVKISSENAVKLTGSYAGKEFSEDKAEYELEITEAGTLEVKGVNADGKESDVFTYTFTIGEVDPNRPALGARYRQLFNNPTDYIDLSLTEDYYVIAAKQESKMKAMSTTFSGNNILSTESFETEEISTGAQAFTIVKPTAADVLIFKLVDQDGQWGLKTVNLGDGFTDQQRYLTAVDDKSTTLTFSEEFKPIYISFTDRKNATIKFVEGGSRSLVLGGSGNNAGNYFNYMESGTAVPQLYRLTEAENFEPDYKDFVLRRTEELPIQIPNDPKPDELSYKIVKSEGGSFTDLEIVDGVIKAGENATLGNDFRIEVTWPETSEWFGGMSKIQFVVKEPLKDPLLGFQHEVVRGKMGVGVVSLAARHLGDGEITYSSSDESVVKFNEDNVHTGIIRADGVVGPGEATITAVIAETEDYFSWTATYKIIIEEADVTTVEGTASFDFALVDSDDGKVPPYGLWDNATSSTYEKDRNDTKPVVEEIHATDNNAVYLTFTHATGQASYRYWKSDGALNITSTTQMWVNAPDGCAIKKIEFTVPSGRSNNLTLYGDQSGTLSSNTWTAGDDDCHVVKFVTAGPTYLATISVTLEASKEGGASGIVLSFPGDNDQRVLNFFAKERVPLPVLTYEGIKFENIKFDIDEMGDEEEDQEKYEGFYVIEHDAADKLFVTVFEPGVYTLRAFHGEYTANTAKAILRLNVFPTLTVSPSTGDLADDDRNEAHNVTIANSDVDDEGNETLTVPIPTKDELFLNEKGKEDNVLIAQFSTIELLDEVVVNEIGEDPVTYSLATMEKGFAHEFKNDGTITYSFRYGSEEAFTANAVVNVIMMPRTPTYSKTDNGYTVVPSKNATLRYRLTVENQGAKTQARRRAAEENPWDSNDGEKEFSRTSDEAMKLVGNRALTDDEVLVVEFYGEKDVEKMTGLGNNGKGVEGFGEPLVTSYSVIGLGLNGLSGVEDVNMAIGNDEVRYYNLQGVEIPEPTVPGVYIRAKGRTAEKVYVF